MVAYHFLISKLRKLSKKSLCFGKTRPFQENSWQMGRDYIYCNNVGANKIQVFNCDHEIWLV